jgi:tRNA(His) guanylyltransferase
MKNDSLGDRMKRYEMEEAGRRLMPRLPILARLDGRAFHTFTKGLKRPYDERFSLCMHLTMRDLVEEWDPDLAYTQSDEITLFWLNDEKFEPMQFDGRIHKLVSLLAADASVSFYQHALLNLPAKLESVRGKKPRPKLDCRVWQVPNIEEAYHSFLWREQDATRNSLSMAAQSVYTHRELHQQKRADLHELLFQKGINWNDYPTFFKRGSFAKRVSFHKPLTDAQLARIPEERRPKEAPLRSEVKFLRLGSKEFVNFEDFKFIATTDYELDGRDPLGEKWTGEYENP